MSVDHQPGAADAPASRRLFLAADPDLWLAADDAGMRAQREMVPLPEDGETRPVEGDVVVVPVDDLPRDGTDLAARLADLQPARILLVATDADPSRLEHALRCGAADVVAAPVDPLDLRFRLDLLDRRPAAAGAGDSALASLLHDLANVLGAIRLTAYVVGGLDTGRPATAGDGSGPAPAGPTPGVAALAARLEREVSEAIAILAEIRRRQPRAAGGPLPP